MLPPLIFFDKRVLFVLGSASSFNHETNGITVLMDPTDELLAIRHS